MLRNKDLYTKNCKNCGMVFRTDNSRVQICPSCRKTKKAESIKSENETHKKPKQKFHRVIPGTISINDIVFMLEEYNKKYKQCYTYGKFVSLINQGKIPRRIYRQ